MTSTTLIIIGLLLLVLARVLSIAVGRNKEVPTFDLEPRPLKVGNWTDEELIAVCYIAKYYRRSDEQLIGELAIALNRSASSTLRKIDRLRSAITGRDKGVSDLDVRYSHYMNHISEEDGKELFFDVLRALEADPSNLAYYLDKAKKRVA